MALNVDRTEITGLAPGYHPRPATLQDVEAAVRLMNQYSQWESGENLVSKENILSDWQEPGYSPEANTIGIWDSQGQMVGYIEFYDKGEPHVQFFCWGLVHPDHQGNGLGGALLDWVVAKARQGVPLAPEGTRVVLHQGFLSTNERAAELFKSRGFTPTRSFYRMRIDFQTPPALPEVPEGITIQSMKPGEERQLIWAAYDSFRDHWGFTEEPFEQYFQRWKHRIETDSHYDPALYFAAMDGDEVAGVALCYDHMEFDPTMAWVGTLGVRRAWRKRGLGKALLLHAFNAFYQRGKACAGLGVDASSLTGAVRLYERAGMSVWRTFTTYELELRSGKDLMTQTA